MRRRALVRANKGLSLTEDEATALLAPGDQESLVAAAQRYLPQTPTGKPRLVTYSPKVFIPLTKLCRDRCSYCTFAVAPAALREKGENPFLTIPEVVAIAKKGAAAGCSEALFTLGDQPEDRWPQAKEWLAEAGYDSTLAYLRAAAIAVIEETGLLPHLNPGVMSWQQLQQLRPVAASVGLMLETTATRLYADKGEVHYGSPDKEPAVRLRTLADAGRANIPTTTGLLLGIGESEREFVDGLFAIRDLHKEFGHIQEVLIQNFRAKPGTAASHRPDLDEAAHVRAVAVARIVLGPAHTVQIPPNLSDPDSVLDLLAAGANDLGGISPVTIDHVNPERPWPSIADLTQQLSDNNYQLLPRLCVHPQYLLDPDRWLDPKLHQPTADLATDQGLRDPASLPVGQPWQDADPGYADFAARVRSGRTDLASGIDEVGRMQDSRADFASAYGGWDAVLATAKRVNVDSPGATSTALERRALTLAANDPARLADPANEDLALALMTSEGAVLDDLCRLADELRQETVGDTVTYVVNRNLNFTNVCYTGCRFCAFAQRETDRDSFTLSLAEVGDRVDEAVVAGATEICMQGGIHPKLPGTAYFDLIAEVKRRQPQVHLHAFSPMEIVNGATKADMSIRDWLLAARDAGLDTIPGTAAEILDDEIRWILTKGKLPTDVWIDVVKTAHSLGIRSSSTMMYGHVDQPIHWVRHIRLLRHIQQETQGFTEFVPLPFVHQQSPIYLAGVARPGPTTRDNRAVHALARLMLTGQIDNVQCSWVKLGADGCAVMLAGGANDLGGTLMEETISRMAGSDHGSAKQPADLAAIAELAGRPARQRTTMYGSTDVRIVPLSLHVGGFDAPVGRYSNRSGNSA